MTPLGANSTKAMHIKLHARGHSNTTWTQFCPLLTTIYLYFHLELGQKFAIFVSPATSSCPRNNWMPPQSLFLNHYHEPIVVIWNSIVGVHTQCSFIETSSKRPLDYLLIMVRNFLIELVWTFSVISCICKVEPKSYWSRMRIDIFFRAWNKLNIQNVSKRYLEIV